MMEWVLTVRQISGGDSSSDTSDSDSVTPLVDAAGTADETVPIVVLPPLWSYLLEGISATPLTERGPSLVIPFVPEYLIAVGVSSSSLMSLLSPPCLRWLSFCRGDFPPWGLLGCAPPASRDLPNISVRESNDFRMTFAAFSNRAVSDVADEGSCNSYEGFGFDDAPAIDNGDNGLSILGRGVLRSF
jgi:hypothetical protein